MVQRVPKLRKYYTLSVNTYLTVNGKKIMNNSIFVISLDFELAWGFHYGEKAKGSYRGNILGARTVIPRLLELFHKYDIHATWATVGALACRSKKELTQLINQDQLCSSNSPSLSKYIALNVGENEEDDPVHFAPSLIDLIKKYPNQYIASHTFSHIFLHDQISNIEDFNHDIAAVKKVFPETFINVFARNQFTDEALATLESHGFRAYRGVQENDSMSMLKIHQEGRNKSDFVRLLRLIDSYWPITGHYNYAFEEITGDKLLNIRASSFLRPYNPSLRYLESFKVKRINAGMQRAAQAGGIYHLYWHPHNIGINQTENLDQIEEILQSYQKLNNQYGMRSMSMEEVCEELWKTR